MAHFEQIISFSPVALTYVGIGSTPRTDTVAQYKEEWNQLVPRFVKEAKGTVRCLHFDPLFSYNIDMIREYFALAHPELVYSAGVDSFAWISTDFEVHLYCARITHKDAYHMDDHDDAFLEALAERILQSGGRLVVQDFSGQDLMSTLQTAYAKTADKKRFRQRILFDMTYGDATCDTDMVVTKPICDTRGHFINFTLMSEDEIVTIWTYNAILDKHIRKYFLKKFKAILDYEHANYRRKAQGGVLLYKNDLYDETVTAAEIMKILDEKLRSLFRLFSMMGLVTEDTVKELDRLLCNYRSLDMYQWNNLVRALMT